MKINTFIKKNFSKSNNKNFLIDNIKNKKISYNNILLKTYELKKFFNKIGLKKQDKVAVAMDNSADTAIVYFSLYLFNLVCVPVNLDFNSRIISKFFANLNIKLIITRKNYFNAFSNIKYISNILILNSSSKKIKKLKNERNTYFCNLDKTILGVNNFDKLELPVINKNDLQLIIFTSGTTGIPKKVCHTYGDLYDNARLFISHNKIKPDSVFLNFLPMSYLGGYYNLLFLPFYADSKVVINNPFNSLQSLSFFKLMNKHQINHLWLTPSIAKVIMGVARSRDNLLYFSKNKVRIFIGMDSITNSLKNEFKKKFKVKIYENYGLSETLFISSESKYKKGSFYAGKILKGIKVKILNKEKNQKLKGEILVKSSFLMKNKIDLINENTFRNGWFYTGDIGKIDQLKNLVILGRIKDIIIKGGINISSKEIENNFYNLKKIIKECCVISKRDEFNNVKIILLFIKKDAYKQNDFLEKIKDFSNSTIEKVKQPDFFVEVSNFPKTPSGKIKKNLLIEWIEDKNFNEIDRISLIKETNKIKKINSKKTITISNIVKNSVQASSVQINNFVYEKISKGEKIITLSLGEAFFKIPLFNFNGLPLNKIYHYSHSRGLLELRKKLSEYFLINYDFSFDPETEILITAGSKLGIYMALKTTINSGDEVLISEPAWVSFSEQIKLSGGIPKSIPYYEKIENYNKYISSKTKAIIVNSPHNPTGKIYSYEELDFLYNLASKNNLMFLSDEAYSNFIPNGKKYISLGNIDKNKKNIIISNSISKNFGMSGWRIGYVISNKKIINQILKLNQHLITCPPTILQHYLIKYFDDILKITEPQIKSLLDKRKKVEEYLLSKKLEFLPGKSTFYFFISLGYSKLNSAEFSKILLRDFKVSVVGGHGYGKSCDKFIRLSIGTENLKNIYYGIDCIKNLIRKTKIIH